MIFFVLFLQFITVYLDNKSSMYDFFEEIKKGNVAFAYSKRGILLTLSRTVFFVVPPLLGYVTIQSNISTLIILLISAALINFFVTLAQGFLYNRVSFLEIFTFNQQKLLFQSAIFLLGIIAFTFFLFTPYILNILALIYPNNGIWIVQLNNVLNSIFVFYLIFIFEPTVSQKIDNGADVRIFKLHTFLTRLYGRFLMCIILCIYMIIN
jgi:hypothetical protein